VGSKVPYALRVRWTISTLVTLTAVLAVLGRPAARASASAALPLQRDGQAPGPATALVGGTVIDGNGGAPLADAIVLIAGGRVTAVGPRTRVPIPTDARQVDARGQWILPGLIDTNVHLSLYGGQNDRYESLVTFVEGHATLHGRRYGFRAADGQYFITESELTGKPQEHRVEFTLGSRRVQHYLTTIDNGRIIVLAPSWDVQRGQWFHNVEIIRPDEDDRQVVQQWNKSCVGCHVSRQDNAYDPATRAYKTEWMDFGTSCERCHGPGRAHVSAKTAASKAK